MSDLYTEFALPQEAIEAVRNEEAKLEARLVDLPHERPGAILAFQRAVVPILAALVDAKIDDADWTTVYVARRARAEAEAVVGGVTSRYSAALAWASSDLKEARETVERRERQAALASAFADEEATRASLASEAAEVARVTAYDSEGRLLPVRARKVAG